jgi:hypothetical protein
MPALNEEESVGQTISMIPVEQIRERGMDPEILIIDGGSTDKTIETARSTGAKVISTEKGYGRQYIKGFNIAEGEIFVTADSDCSYPMEEIPELISILIAENLDFISTNRFAGMESDSMLPLNKFGNRVLTFFTNLLFGFGLKDSQSGMWIFRREILPSLKLSGNGMSLSQEIKIKAFGRFRSREINSTYRKRVGTVKLRMFIDGLNNLFNLFKLKITG